jgi:hypothetical protein
MAVGKTFVESLIHEQKDLRHKIIYSIIGYINDSPQKRIEFYGTDHDIRLNINHPNYTSAVHVKLLEISMNPNYVVTTNLFSDLDTDRYDLADIHHIDNILSFKVKTLDDLNHYLVSDEEFSNDWENEDSPLSFNDIFTDDLMEILNRLSLLNETE